MGDATEGGTGLDGGLERFYTGAERTFMEGWRGVTVAVLDGGNGGRTAWKDRMDPLDIWDKDASRRSRLIEGG